VQTVTVLLSVLIVVAVALCGVAIWALLEGVKTAKSIRTLSDNLDARIVPFIEKADVTVDALNIELLRVDAIVTRFEEISDAVESTSRTVQGVANAPVEIVTDIADRVRRAWKTRKHATPEGYGPQPEDATPTEEHVSAVDPPAQSVVDTEPVSDVQTTDSEGNRTAHVQ
jgi:hypothetical protein